MVRNAAIVVILVKNIGINNESMVDATAVLTFFPSLISRKNFVTTWTPSEFAMVKRTIGIDVLSNAKRNRSDPVMLYIQPMKPIMDTKDEKLDAIIGDVKVCQKKQQPVLVGTSSIESSESISLLLKKDNIRHEVLNAKQHQREAEIIANAGAPGSVTIATNMAGRGTDIVLGGRLPEETSDAEKLAWKEKHEDVISAGGLHIIGTERNESRRVDNQLRGRSGRQGDVGSTRFYLSLEDSLMKIFASEKTYSI